ncbi:hypothetical protein LPJ70_003816, partial [Coemansia sp. RSA 2708]
HVIDGGHLSKSIACFEHNSACTRSALAQQRDEIEASIGWFYRLSLIMHKWRFDTSALSLHSMQLSFELDNAGQLVTCQPYTIKDSNCLIKEFMLLANMSIAARIEASFPNSALLCRHALPLECCLEDVCHQLAHAGIEIDTQSASTISDSIRCISNADTRYTVKEMLTQPMQRTVYFSTHTIHDRAEYHHYALNMPLYTHFTSPICRYADVIVHHLLEALLAIHGNHKVQDASLKLFLVNYLAATALCTNVPGIITHAIITKIGENGISFVTPLFGVDGIIYMDRITDHKNQVIFANGHEWKLHLW